MSFPRKIREQVYAKCNGHCAYCGCELEMKDMQVDHIVPRYNNYPRCGAIVEGLDDLDNLMPSCRQCNFYKSSYSLEGFRHTLMEVLPRSIEKLFQVRIGMKYGYVQKGEPWDGKFYFEKLQEKKQGKRPDGNAD